MNTLKETLKLVESKVKEIPSARKDILDRVVAYMQAKIQKDQSIRLNFICTHNSRRSHLAQIWSYLAANFYEIPNVTCYSGGTEATAVYPTIIQTLVNQGLDIYQLSEGENPVYAIKCNENSDPLIVFSKAFDHPFNPKSDFLAIMTCSDADENCPTVFGAEKRVAMTFNDPKRFDNSPLKEDKYQERSLQIASEMFYIFSKI